MTVNYYIETRNQFLRFALETLYQQNQFAQDTCIIDLTSCHSLLEVLRYVRRNNDVNRFIFIGNSSAVSRALVSLVSIESHAPIEKYHEVICDCPGISYGVAIRLLLARRNMDNFTHRDKTTVYGLLLNDSMNEAARVMGISVKLFYMRVNRLVKVLNMRSSLQVHQFFRYEYHPSFVRRKMNEHHCVSVRQWREIW
ncbi:Uncharacterised protein [Kluyvera ascorbata]|nr:Uncharacterised protein [Kluyvera ascorbata]